MSTLSDLVSVHVCEANGINIYFFFRVADPNKNSTKLHIRYRAAPRGHRGAPPPFNSRDWGAKNEAKSRLFPLFHHVADAPFPPNWNQVLVLDRIISVNLSQKNNGTLCV